MDFSLTTLFVTPVGQTTLPSSGSTQDLTAGQVGVFLPDYSLATAANIAAGKYFYLAQGRENTYLQGSKRSDKISGALQAGGIAGNVTEWYKVAGSPTASNQIIEISGFTVKPGEDLTLSLRAHSSYIDTLYHNGLTKSVTIPGSCLDCGGDPCVEVDPELIVDQLLAKIAEGATGINPDNSSLSTYFTFEKIGTGASTVLRIEGKPLTKYGQPCDIAAESHEYDRMWFQSWIYKGPATSADFLVADACDTVGTVETIQEAGYATGTSEEIAQLEQNFYSYQAGFLKHLYRNAGYNQNFESYVNAGTSYDTYYIKFRDYDQATQTWGDYIREDSMVIIACEAGSAFGVLLEAVLVAALGAVSADNTVYTTTTTTTA